MSRTLICNGDLVQDGDITKKNILIEKDRVAAILPPTSFVPADRIINAEGYFLSHGFVDIHTHGGYGYDFMDGTVEAYTGAAEGHVRHGTTALVPTTLASSKEELKKTFDTFRTAKGVKTKGTKLLGLHIEGPYISPQQGGAQDPRYIRRPNPREYEELLSCSDDILRWTIAPEIEGALELGKYLAQRHILPSIGHSNATYEQVKKAFDCGFTHITHLYSAMSSITRTMGFRHAGVIESAYLMNGMTVEIIADGRHLPAPLLQMVYRFIGAERTALITDSMRGAGCPEGQSILGSLKNGQAVLIEDGVAKLPDRSAFAGSVATCDTLVRTMIREGEASLEQAVAMMTSVPAKIIGKGDQIGRIEPGKAADLILFDKDIHVMMTFIDGKTVYISRKFSEDETMNVSSF